MRRGAILSVKSIAPLVLVMVFIGFITTVATISTVEVIFRYDTPLSDVIKEIDLTTDISYGEIMISKKLQSFDDGHFGVPKKIKFPESKTYYDIIESRLEDNQWKAVRGLAHYFISAEPIHKIFGQAFIYMRVNTSTTHDVGRIINGDVVDLVTTEGWQLTYKVNHVADDPSSLPNDTKDKTSIIAILVDENSNGIHCFDAELLKVGERI